MNQTTPKRAPAPPAFDIEIRPRTVLIWERGGRDCIIWEHDDGTLLAGCWHATAPAMVQRLAEAREAAEAALAARSESAP